MGFWNWFGHLGTGGITPNSNPPSSPSSVGGSDYTPGDPHGVEFDQTQTLTRALPTLSPARLRRPAPSP